MNHPSHIGLFAVYVYITHPTASCIDPILVKNVVYHRYCLCFSCLVIAPVNPPQNVMLFQESSDSLRVTWNHPCDGPPATHYLITYVGVQFGVDFSTNQQQSLIVSKENTSAMIEDLNLTAGSMYIVAVTSVFNKVSKASELVPIYIRK